MKLHREGRVIIPLALIFVSVVVGGTFLLTEDTPYTWIAWLLLLGGIVLMTLVFNFFRNPEVKPFIGERTIVAPCDGKVVVIEEVEDKVYFNGPVRQVSIFMSPLNVHVNRNPITGVVRFFKYFPGKYLVAFHPKSSTLNEHTYTVAENSHVAVAYKQIAGAVARRIRWYIDEGDRVEQGKEFGFIKFGSRIDLLIPLECEVKVDLNQKTKAGITVIAEVTQ